MGIPTILIRGGRIWDGTRFTKGDLALADGRVAAIGSSGGFKADRLFDAVGQIIAPGLVDAHLHFLGISNDDIGMQPEMACLPFGVTAAAECGAEQGDSETLSRTAVRTVAFVSAVIRENRLDEAATEERLTRFAGKAVGIKIYFDVTASPVTDIQPLLEACRFAHNRGLKLMVHCAHSPVPMADILQALSPGDILTHVFHGYENTAAADGFACLFEAQKRGIILDTGFAGHVHTSPEVVRAAFAAGFRPNTVSTDLTCLSAYTRGGLYGLPLCMSLCRAQGMSEEEVLRAVTVNAADALGQPGWGRLTVGGRADVTVLDESGGAWHLTAEDGSLSGEKSYRCRLTVMDGRVLYRA